MIGAALGLARATGRAPKILAVHPPQHSPPNMHAWLWQRVARVAGGPTDLPVLGPREAEQLAHRLGIEILRESDPQCLVRVPWEEKLGADGPAHAMVVGYFQHEGYLRLAEDEIRALLAPVPEHVAGEVARVDASCVAIHIRMGDFLASAKHYIPLEGYYKRAVARAREVFGEGVRFLVFTNDRAAAIAMYGGLLGDGVDVWQGSCEEADLYAMAQCRGIICPNSTFSWWAAWLAGPKGTWRAIPDRWLTDRGDVLHQEGAEVIPVGGP